MLFTEHSNHIVWASGRQEFLRSLEFSHLMRISLPKEKTRPGKFVAAQFFCFGLIQLVMFVVVRRTEDIILASKYWLRCGFSAKRAYLMLAPELGKSKIAARKFPLTL